MITRQNNKAYDTLKALTKTNQPRTVIINDKDGKILTDSDEVLECRLQCPLPLQTPLKCIPSTSQPNLHRKWRQSTKNEERSNKYKNR